MNFAPINPHSTFAYSGIKFSAISYIFSFGLDVKNRLKNLSFLSFENTVLFLVE
jgi:hypoxanthine-guanine phosphoribosyltransferase